MSLKGFGRNLLVSLAVQLASGDPALVAEACQSCSTMSRCSPTWRPDSNITGSAGSTRSVVRAGSRIQVERGGPGVQTEGGYGFHVLLGLGEFAKVGESSWLC